MKNSQLNILLVEDDPGDARLFKRNLDKTRLTNFQLHHADCLENALECLENERFDVVLLDLGLPDCSGLTLVARVLKVCREIPVIVLTGNSDESLAEEAISQGAQDYLLKDELVPITLQRVLTYAVGRQQARVQLHKANARLEDANLRLGEKNRRLADMYETAHQFVDHVSHEFRTPLTVIREYATIIRDGLVGEVNDQQREFLDVVSDRTDDLANMVDDMLDVSKLEAGLLSVWRRETELHSILSRVRPALEQKSGVKKVGLEFDLDENLPSVYCDGEKIGRVIINLAINAIKFCGEGGSVKVWAKLAPDSSDLLVGVTDNGPGISQENLKLIFERFEQVDATAKSSTKGFGLGLSIAKELVALNFGKMNVESEPGTGSTFSFSIPLWDPIDLATRHVTRVNDRSELNTEMTLLVVTTDRPVDAPVANVVDEFLQYTFRAGDGVFQIAPSTWLALVSCPSTRARFLTERAQETWADENRNRPGGDHMPGIIFRACGSWLVETQKDDILDQLHNEVIAVAGASDSDDPYLKNYKASEAIGHGSSERGTTAPVSRVLVVDDDIELRNGMAVRLKAIGYQVITATNGKEAVDAAIAHHPDAMLLDNFMPEMSGMEALTCLANHPQAKHIPIIMLSASLRDRDKALEEGARYYFQKPCPAETVLSALAEVIEQTVTQGVS